MIDPGTIEFTASENGDPEQVLLQLDQALSALAGDEEYKLGMHTIVPGAGDVIGVRVPDLRTLASRLALVFKGRPASLVALARACWGRGSREHRMIALFTLAGMKKLPSQERWSLAEAFLPDVQDWETCDQLCAALSGQALAENAEYMDQLEDWAGNDNFWVRRVAIVSTVLLRRGKFDRALARSLNEWTLRLCERLLDDEEKYIRKAVDWAIRELIKRDYELGREFLLERASRQPGHPERATLKLAAKKLHPADQARFLDMLAVGNSR
jgi:3-methyladenine DNA glycosylase AlkD